MKKLILTIIFIAPIYLSSAQEKPNVGDKLTINKPIGQTYKYITFPKKNFIIKRGKVGNYKSVIGKIVVIKDVLTNENDNTYVILKKQDGKKFFGFLSQVKANYEDAIATEELSQFNISN